MSGRERGGGSSGYHDARTKVVAGVEVAHERHTLGAVVLHENHRVVQLRRGEGQSSSLRCERVLCAGAGAGRGSARRPPLTGRSHLFHSHRVVKRAGRLAHGSLKISVRLKSCCRRCRREMRTAAARRSTRVRKPHAAPRLSNAVGVGFRALQHGAALGRQRGVEEVLRCCSQSLRSRRRCNCAHLSC